MKQPPANEEAKNRRQKLAALKKTKIATDDPNALTLMVATDGNVFAKSVFADGSERDYDNAYKIIMTPVDVSTTAKIITLAKELALRAEYCITYGAIAPHVEKNTPVRRLQKPRPNEPASFYEVPRYVFLLDLDLHDIALPDDFDPHDLFAAASLARLQLPAAFHDVEMVFVASSGYLRKPGLRFRAWVRLSRPLTPSRFRRWMHATKPLGRKKPVVDTAPCSANGVNYTASPIFEDPAMDPLPNGRIVVIPGRPTVEVPPDEFFEIQKPARGQSKAPRTAGAEKKVEKAKPKAPTRAQKEERAPQSDLDETFAHLWDDDVAIATAREYLANAPIGVQSEGRHDAAVGIFMRLGDIGIMPETAGDLMFEVWSPKCVPPYVDRDELEREIVGLEFAREKPLGHAHPRAFETPLAAEEAAITAPEGCPPLDMGFVTLAEGRRRLAETRAMIADRFYEWELAQANGAVTAPPVYGQRATVGIGKSEEFLRLAVTVLIALRLKRTGRRSRRAVIFAVPTHDLSAELEQRFSAIAAEALKALLADMRKEGASEERTRRISRKARLTVATRRGRGARNPDGSGERMCRNLKAANEALALEQDVEPTVCKFCRFKDDCAYLAQTKGADLIIVAHQSLFQSGQKFLPAAGVECVFIDETIDAAALCGVGDEQPATVRLSDLAPHATPLPWRMSLRNAKRLESLRAAVQRALARVKPGRVSAAFMRKAGLTADDAAWAATAERRRIYYGNERTALEYNRSVKPMTAMWLAIADLLQDGGPDVSGRLLLTGGKGKPRVLHVSGYAAIHEDFRKPTLLIDAAFNAARARLLFPNIIEMAPIQVDAPFTTVLKSTGRKSSMRELLPVKPRDPIKGLTPEEKALDTTAANNRRAVRANLINLARRHGGKVVVFTYKELIGPLDLPETIDTANLGGLAGRDCWRDFDVAVILGRLSTPPATVESIAGAITGRMPAPRENAGWWYPQRRVLQPYRLKDGAGFVGVPMDAAWHPDEMAELQRFRICEEEINQAAGRLRPINRTPANPATIIVLNDAPLPELPVDEFFNADAFYRISPADQMFAEAGIAFEVAADAFKAYPGMWPSVEAAKKAIARAERGGAGQIPIYKDYIIRKCPAPQTVRYQRTGAGHRPAICRAELTDVSGLRDALERLIGPLARFEIIPDPEPPAGEDQRIADAPPSLAPSEEEMQALVHRWFEPIDDLPPADHVEEQITAFADLMGCSVRKVKDWIGGAPVVVTAQRVKAARPAI